jgi:hypothetical protein
MMEDEHITPEEMELIKTHLEATRNAVIYGVSFLKMEYIKGQIKTSVVKPEDYSQLTGEVPKFHFKN